MRGRRRWVLGIAAAVVGGVALYNGVGTSSAAEGDASLEPSEESEDAPSEAAGADSAQQRTEPPVPKHMLADPEVAPAMPAVPSPYGPLKVSPELAKQFLAERQEKFAATLDAVIEQEGRDTSYEQELKGKAQVGMEALAINGTRVSATECADSLCRLTFEFDSEDDQERLEPLLRNIGMVTGGESWLKRLEDDEQYVSAVYLSRGGRLPGSTDLE